MARQTLSSYLPTCKYNVQVWPHDEMLFSFDEDECEPSDMEWQWEQYDHKRLKKDHESGKYHVDWFFKNSE